MASGAAGGVGGAGAADVMTEPTLTLGPLPWSEETIARAYFADFRGVWAAIREHPGYPAHRALAAVEQSFEIFGDIVEELVTKIEAFDTAAKTRTFWTRPARADFDSHVRSVRRAMFAATTAAVAWRDIVRAVSAHCVEAGHPLPGWDVKWPTLTGRLDHQFVVDLRNCISHATCYSRLAGALRHCGARESPEGEISLNPRDIIRMRQAGRWRSRIPQRRRGRDRLLPPF